MLTALAILVLLTYSASAALYLADVLGREERTGRLKRFGMMTAIGSNVLLVGGMGAVLPVAEFLSIRQAPALLALVVSLGWLAVRNRTRDWLSGALVSTAGATSMLAYLFELQRQASEHGGSSAILRVHIALAIVGLGAFALAAFHAALYLLHERLLRRRDFGRLFRMMPSLEELDLTSFRIVALGFFIYTLALGLGVTASVQSNLSLLDARLLLASSAWVAFAVIVWGRLSRGWRGGHAAWTTIGGWTAACLVLALYFAGRG